MGTLAYNQLWGPTRKSGETLSAPIVYFNDFISAFFCPDDALTAESDPSAEFSEVAERGEWFVSQDTTGGASTIICNDAADGGELALLSSADTGDRLNCQINGEPFLLTTSRKMVFEARVRVSSITVGAMFIGLATPTTNAHAEIDAATASLRYIGFTRSTDADIEYATAGTDLDNRVDTLQDFVADTFVVLAFEWDGVDTARFFVDGVLRASTTTNIPLDSYMAPVMCVENTSAAANTLTLDYFLVMNDRQA